MSLSTVTSMPIEISSNWIGSILNAKRKVHVFLSEKGMKIQIVSQKALLEQLKDKLKLDLGLKTDQIVPKILLMNTEVSLEKLGLNHLQGTSLLKYFQQPSRLNQIKKTLQSITEVDLKGPLQPLVDKIKRAVFFTSIQSEKESGNHDMHKWFYGAGIALISLIGYSILYYALRNHDKERDVVTGNYEKVVKSFKPFEISKNITSPIVHCQKSVITDLSIIPTPKALISPSFFPQTHLKEIDQPVFTPMKKKPEESIVIISSTIPDHSDEHSLPSRINRFIWTLLHDKLPIAGFIATVFAGTMGLFKFVKARDEEHKAFREEKTMQVPIENSPPKITQTMPVTNVSSPIERTQTMPVTNVSSPIERTQTMPVTIENSPPKITQTMPVTIENSLSGITPKMQEEERIKKIKENVRKNARFSRIENNHEELSKIAEQSKMEQIKKEEAKWEKKKKTINKAILASEKNLQDLIDQSKEMTGEKVLILETYVKQNREKNLSEISKSVKYPNSSQPKVRKIWLKNLMKSKNSKFAGVYTALVDGTYNPGYS